jgi:hypothetical protein
MPAEQTLNDAVVDADHRIGDFHGSRSTGAGSSKHSISRWSLWRLSPCGLIEHPRSGTRQIPISCQCFGSDGELGGFRPFAA